MKKGEIVAYHVYDNIDLCWCSDHDLSCPVHPFSSHAWRHHDSYHDHDREAAHICRETHSSLFCGRIYHANGIDNGGRPSHFCEYPPAASFQVASGGRALILVPANKTDVSASHLNPTSLRYLCGGDVSQVARPWCLGDVPAG